MTPVFVLDRSGGWTDPVLTADPAVVAAADADRRQPARFYLPNKTVNPSAAVPGITPLYRGNNSSFYTKLLQDYQFQLQETLGNSWPDALDDTTQALRPPGRVRARPTGTRRNILTDSRRHLGFGYNLQGNAKFNSDIGVTIEGPTQTHTITFDRRAGGELDFWRVQMSSPAVDLQLVNRGEDYGRCFQSAIFLFEEVGLPGELRHNPTQAGSTYSLRDDHPVGPPPGWIVDDWQCQASPLVSASMRSMPDGSTEVKLLTLPLEFEPELPLGQAAGSAVYQPVYWMNSRVLTTWTFNWKGQEGVHKLTTDWFQPFDIPHLVLGPAPAPLRFLKTHAFFVAPVFDNFWVYDAAADSETEAREGIEGPDYSGADDYDVFTLQTNDWRKAAGKSPARGPWASPLSSGAGGLIHRDTGAGRGAGTGFAIGQYVNLVPTLSVAAENQRSWTVVNYHANYTEDLGFPPGQDGFLVDFQHAATQSFGGIPVGWHRTSTSFFLTGTYAQVKAKMRQLYLENTNAS